MNTNERKVANAIGGKTARACESCLKNRARWFCTADDAFLCQSCDASVHSANLLASRHERVRLKTSSNASTAPTWLQGFTRKARTPRQNKAVKSEYLVVVPETTNGEDPFLEENDQEEEEEEEQFHCRVPVFDPFDDTAFCIDEIGGGKEEEQEGDHDHDRIGSFLLGDNETCHDLNLEELMSCGDLELAEFAADVESLLGTTGIEENRGIDEDRGINDLRIRMADFEDDHGNRVDELSSGNVVNVEEFDKDDDGEMMRDEVQAVIECHFDPALDMEFNFDFDCTYSTSNGEEEEDKKQTMVSIGNTSTGNNIDHSGSNESQIEKRMLLRLNHEAVISAWASTQGSPWTNGVRPDQFNLDEFMVACSHDIYGLGGGRSGANDAGRKERVSRYREKRRTRLFSKKIRYEVRKLNAEKRPRMKGRFVKRTSISESSLAYLI